MAITGMGGSTTVVVVSTGGSVPTAGTGAARPAALAGRRAAAIAGARSP